MSSGDFKFDLLTAANGRLQEIYKEFLDSKIYIKKLESENAALREKLEIAKEALRTMSDSPHEKYIKEYEQKRWSSWKGVCLRRRLQAKEALSKLESNGSVE